METEIYKQIHSIEETHWWYVARRSIIFDWVNNILASYSDPKVLDVGCGTGYNVSMLEKLGYLSLIGVDISFDALGYCRSRNSPALICGDSISLPFKEGSFDVILALDLIEHLADDTKALKEYQRLLSVNGKLILFAPAFNFLWGVQDMLGHHQRRYTAKDLSNKINKTGLSIVKITYANAFLFPLIFAARTFLRFLPLKSTFVSENDLSPKWINGFLKTVFQTEKWFLKKVNFPIGVSLFCIAEKLK
jgi:SAM-dependent methyltransferase